MVEAEDVVAQDIARRLEAAGVDNIEAINPPSVRGHERVWILLLTDGDRTGKASRALKRISWVRDVAPATLARSAVTFVVEGRHRD